MSISLVSNQKIAETSSKGNQEKWYYAGTDNWYKMDQFEYKALAETVISQLLERSNIECDTPFTFLRYRMESLCVHGQKRTGCVSSNFLKEGQSIITLNHLLSRCLGMPLRDKLVRLTSDKRRITYPSRSHGKTIRALRTFPGISHCSLKWTRCSATTTGILTTSLSSRKTVFTATALFLTTEPDFSPTRFSRMDIEPTALIASLKARPFLTTFTRQRNTARSLFGPQLRMPILTAAEIREVLSPALEFYSARDRGAITDRVTACIMLRQRAK